MLLRTRIKMCGMTRLDDIRYAVSLGVDAIGLIFYQKSPRCVTIEQAEVLLECLPVFVDAVAVFVNPEVRFVESILHHLPIQCLQFHGQESAEWCERFGKPYIKAIPALSATHIQEASETYEHASAILLDTPSSTQFGGTGKTFDWAVIPSALSKPIIASGGLTEENVKCAVSTISPYAVDVCTGIEISPGEKDRLKMHRFVAAVWGEGR